MRWLAAVALVACSKQAPTPVASSAAPSAPAAPTPAPSSSAPAEWAPGPDVEVLGQIVAQTLKPKGVEDGKVLRTESFDVPGWAVAWRSSVKGNPAAWSIHLEGSGADACKPARFAPTASLMHSEGALPLQAQWFKLAGGGPLRGLIVKAFTNDVRDCSWNFATVAYAQHQGWKPPPTTAP